MFLIINEWNPVRCDSEIPITFDTVRLTPETSNIPGRKNLNILVSESRTGALSFGAGFGSVSSTQFFLEMKQSNFDINNWRSGFQGRRTKI